MADETLVKKLDELISLVKAQLELTNRANQEAMTARARQHLAERLSQVPEEQADESSFADPPTPTPAARPRRSVAFADDGERTYTDRETYSTPTGSRYTKPRTEAASGEEGYDTISLEDLPHSQQKSLSTPFPKFNPRDVELFVIEAEAWFKFNRVYDHETMINYTGTQLDGSAREWWTSKLRVDRPRQGKLFHDWHFFTKRLSEQYNPRNVRMEAYNKLLALRLTSDTPGAATRHVERFRDLKSQVNLEDTELLIDLFRGSLTRSLQEKFERNPPSDRWGWYREVEEIDRQRMSLQQASSRHPSLPAPRGGIAASQRPVGPAAVSPGRQPAPPAPGTPYRPGNRPLPPHLAQNLRPRAPAGGTGPTTFGSTVCHLCQGTGHWARDCPSRKAPLATPRPAGPRVAVTLEDPQQGGQPPEEAVEAEQADDGEDYGYDSVDQEPLDLTQFESPAAAANQAVPQDDNDDAQENCYGAMH